MAFSFEINESKNLVTVVCDASTPSAERKAIIDELVDTLVKKPSLNIFFDISHLDLEDSANKQSDYCELFTKKKKYFNKSRVAFYAGRRKAYVRPVLFKAFAFVQRFKNFALFDNKIIASVWLNDRTH